jgi:hypothetical protein
MNKAMQEAIAILKAQAGEEGGSFRGGDPEELQEKREIKREEQAASGELEDAAENMEEPDQSEIEEMIEEEKEKEASKSLPFRPTGLEISPVDTGSDYSPKTTGGDFHTKPPVKDIPPTKEVRPGKNQGKKWSEVVDFETPFQGQTWVHLRQHGLRGGKDAVEREKAKILKAFNHGLTFDPSFYIAKALKGEIVPGHKYIYRYMDEDGQWQYEYSGGVHGNHGPHHIGNAQGHTVDVPEHIDPQKTSPKEAFDAAKEHHEHHGGVYKLKFPDKEGNYRDVIMRIKGHQGQEKRTSRPIEIFDESLIRQHQKIGPEDEINYKKMPAKYAKGAHGGQSMSGFDALEAHRKRHATHVEVDAEGKPLLEWRQDRQGKSFSFRWLDKNHPVAEEEKKGTAESGWQRGRFKNIEQLRRFVADKKNQHAQIMGQLKTDHEKIFGKPATNIVQQGLPKKTIEIGYRHAGGWKKDPETGESYWENPTGLESERYKKKRKVLHVDWDAAAQKAGATNGDRYRDRLLLDLVGFPSPTRPLGGENLGILIHSANQLIREENVRRASAGKPALEGRSKNEALQELFLAGTMGASQALDTYNAAHESKSKFTTHLANSIKHFQRKGLGEFVRGRAVAAGETPVEFFQGADTKNFNAVMGALSQAMEEHVGSGSSKYKNLDQWFDKTENYLSDLAFDHEDEDLVNAAHDEFSSLRSYHDSSPENFDHGLVLDFIQKWNKDTYGGPDFIPEPASGHTDQVQDAIDQVMRGAHGFEELYRIQYGDNRLNADLKNLPFNLELDESGDYVTDENGGRQETKAGKEIQDRVEKEGLKTFKDLLQSIAKDPLKTNRAKGQFDRISLWFNHPDQDKKYGPIHASGPSDFQGEDRASKGLVSEAVVKVRRKMDKAASILKSVEQPKTEENSRPDVQYHSQIDGKHYYEDPQGNLFQGTNAPVGHEAHDENLGSPTLSENELTSENAPHLFDEQGRKLDRPVPEGAQVEDNPDYDPDPSSGKTWAKKYTHPETGDSGYIYYHRDQLVNPKVRHHSKIKYLDAQLPKIRQWYKERLSSDNLADRAVGLYFALIDQGKVKHDDEKNGGLATLTVGMVEDLGGAVRFKFNDGHIVTVTLDDGLKSILGELLENKGPNDLVFSVEGKPLDPKVIEDFLQSTFGVSAASFRKLHASSEFSKQFQNLASGESDHDALKEAGDNAASAVAESLGHSDPSAVEEDIDPITKEALHISARLQPAVKSLTYSGHKLQDRVNWRGLKVSIENKKGSKRKWYDKGAKKEGETLMHYSYGYVRGSKGTDGDHVDVYLGPNEESDRVFIVHQQKAPEFKEYDEDKVMLGFDSVDEAKAAYLKQYDNPKFFGSMSEMSFEEFSDKVTDKGSHGKILKSKVVHQVRSDHPDKTEEEKLFSQWLHMYPVHEHEVHLKHHTKPADEEHHSGSTVEVKTQELEL